MVSSRLNNRANLSGLTVTSVSPGRSVLIALSNQKRACRSWICPTPFRSKPDRIQQLSRSSPEELDYEVGEATIWRALRG